MNNILTAIKVIIESSPISVKNASNSSNRANQAGDALEDYVKNAFANCIGQEQNEINRARSQTFSYLGNSTNPPDAMLRGGDAIEIKKIESLDTGTLQLNSSYPKNKLYSDNPKISKACRDCENWQEKDMLYVVGQVNGEKLHNLYFVYGDLYCDSHEVYEKYENAIKDGLNGIGEVELSETKELGRVNKVDHLQITSLRIRGMWLIKSPFIHFAYLTKENTKEYNFRLVALIPQDKYQSFDNIQEFEKFCNERKVSLNDVDIASPQNPANLISAKMITYVY